MPHGSDVPQTLRWGVPRRSFLTWMGAAAALPLHARTDNPFFALCMDTHDEKKRDLAAQARMLRELGYAGAGHLWFDQVADRLATLDREGLTLFQIYMRVNLGAQAPEPYDPRLRQVLPLLTGRETQLAALVTGGRPSDAALDDRAVEVLGEIADLAQPYGVRLALYPHRKNWLERVEDALRVVQKARRPNMGAMFNLCHWLAAEEEAGLVPLLRAARPHLLAVSINGADRGAEIRSGAGRWIQPLGRGTFDMLGFLRELQRIGYRGPVGLQCYGLPGDAAVHLRESMTAWRALRQRLQTDS